MFKETITSFVLSRKHGGQPGILHWQIGCSHDFGPGSYQVRCCYLASNKYLPICLYKLVQKEHIASIACRSKSGNNQNHKSKTCIFKNRILWYIQTGPVFWLQQGGVCSFCSILLRWINEIHTYIDIGIPVILVCWVAALSRSAPKVFSAPRTPPTTPYRDPPKGTWISRVWNLGRPRLGWNEWSTLWGKKTTQKK